MGSTVLVGSAAASSSGVFTLRVPAPMSYQSAVSQRTHSINSRSPKS
jgi:hypothetical protein